MNRLWVGTRVRAACPLPGFPCCLGALHSPLPCCCTFLALFSLFLLRPMSCCVRCSLSFPSSPSPTLAGTGCDDVQDVEVPCSVPATDCSCRTLPTHGVHSTDSARPILSPRQVEGGSSAQRPCLCSTLLGLLNLESAAIVSVLPVGPPPTSRGCDHLTSST